MNELIIVVAQYAIYAVAVGAVIAWLLVPRPRKFDLAVQAVVTVIAVAILVKIAGTLHTDPRPFVQDPSLHPLFPHPKDNGFPSDHTALTFGIAAIVTVYRRAIGIGLMVISIGIGAARVAAHVHHVQDIVGAVGIGIVAAALAVLVTQPLLHASWWPNSERSRDT